MTLERPCGNLGVGTLGRKPEAANAATIHAICTYLTQEKDVHRTGIKGIKIFCQQA